MAASISLSTTGHLSTGGVSSSLSSSFLSHSQGSTASCNKSSFKSSISGGSVSFSSPTSRGFSGPRCRAKVLQSSEAPLSTATTLYGILGLEQGIIQLERHQELLPEACKDVPSGSVSGRGLGGVHEDVYTSSGRVRGAFRPRAESAIRLPADKSARPGLSWIEERGEEEQRE
ncbi:unnamed protein product [Calypogeia fissa]